MIYFTLSVDNPFYKENSDNKLKHFVSFNKKLTRNKNFEFEVIKWQMDRIFNINMDLRWLGRDHAGPEFSLDILGFYVNIKVYDGRHWNYETGSWEKYE